MKKKKEKNVSTKLGKGVKFIKKVTNRWEGRRSPVGPERRNQSAPVPNAMPSTGLHYSAQRVDTWIRVNDPSAGSPTETLLRLLLPLNDQV
jgi:hypothetical protein